MSRARTAIGAIETHRVDGATVEFTRVPVRRRTGHTHDGPGDPREQALHEIRIDGQHVGLAWRPHGFGRQWWRIDRLGPEIAYERGLGDVTVSERGTPSPERRMWDLEAVARRAVEYLRKPDWEHLPPRLATLETLERWMEGRAATREAERIESEARQERWAREREAAKAAAETLRVEILEGLRSVDERLGGDLTNLEANAIRLAIARYEGEAPR